MIAKLRSQVLLAVRSEFGRNTIWVTAVSAIERIFAVVQTVVIARLLGITEYGIYGLLFGTIGFVASVLGLQMGLTATVYVARYRAAEKSKAAAVMAITRRFGWAVAILFVAGAIPFSETLSRVLLGSGNYQMPLVLSAIFVGATIVSGVQDGIAQGFEIFRALAKLKIAVAILTLLSMYPMASNFGLVGVLLAVLVGLAVKYTLLNRLISQTRNDANIPKSGSGVSFRVLVAGFALPSMVVSLGVGFITWLGMYMLSRQSSGFEQVAFVSTGLQWRGPMLLLAASLGGVAIPAFSRLDAHGNAAHSQNLRRQLVYLNLSAASILALVIVAGAGAIMKMYGDDFLEGRLMFSIVVLSTIPTVVANVYLQEMVGSARMWRQFWLHVPFVGALSAGFLVLVPRYQSLGYALSLLIGSSILLLSVIAASTLERRPAPDDNAGM